MLFLHLNQYVCVRLYMPRGIQNASAENLTDKRLMLTSEKESLHKNQRVEAFRHFLLGEGFSAFNWKPSSGWGRVMSRWYHSNISGNLLKPDTISIQNEVFVDTSPLSSKTTNNYHFFPPKKNGPQLLLHHLLQHLMCSHHGTAPQEGNRQKIYIGVVSLQSPPHPSKQKKIGKPKPKTNLFQKQPATLQQQT